MSLYNQYETDVISETEGVWIPYNDGIELRLARAGGSNLPYKKAVEKFARRFKRELQQENLTEEQTIPVFHQVFADTVVLGWRTGMDAIEEGKRTVRYVDTIPNREGKPMKFNRRNCIKIFEELPDFFLILQKDAGNLEYYKTANLEGESKNSSTSSSTTPE